MTLDTNLTAFLPCMCGSLFSPETVAFIFLPCASAHQRASSVKHFRWGGQAVWANEVNYGGLRQHSEGQAWQGSGPLRKSRETWASGSKFGKYSRSGAGLEFYNFNEANLPASPLLDSTFIVQQNDSSCLVVNQRRTGRSSAVLSLCPGAGTVNLPETFVAEPVGRTEKDFPTV